jgi:hypothetical protein
LFLQSFIIGISIVGFEVLMAVGTKMAVFWVLVPCSLVEIYQRFRGPCCLLTLMMEAAKSSETLVNSYQATAIFGISIVLHSTK